MRSLDEHKETPKKRHDRCRYRKRERANPYGEDRTAEKKEEIETFTADPPHFRSIFLHQRNARHGTTLP
jgi:hypothetical protein